MTKTIVHVLAQRAEQTGSGVTLGALVRYADNAGWRQWVSAAITSGDDLPDVGGLPRQRFHPLAFERDELDFAIPGMSDVMPYKSTCYASMNGAQLAAYKDAWRGHIAKVIAEAKPDLIQSHHIWILGSLIKDVAPDVPVVSYCHGTGLRQMELCPHLAQEVIAGCRRHDAFLVLHNDHAEKLRDRLDIPPEKIHIVGAGYRPEIFHEDADVSRDEKSILYIGKYSAAKGLPQLLDAMEKLSGQIPGLVLHVAGSGAGAEAKNLRARMTGMAPQVVMHGQLAQEPLADLMRRCGVCVLPSFYEGLPLVLIEAAACGCRIVATCLSGIVEGFAPRLGDYLSLVDMPRLIGPDTPAPEDIPAFVDRLAEALKQSVQNPPLGRPDLSHFTLESLFTRVESVWNRVITL